jgi:TolB-like protein
MLRTGLVLSALLGTLASSALADSRPTVAVLYFDYSGKDEGLAVLKKGLAQMLISDLGAVGSVRLVECDRIEEVIGELKLGQSAHIDSATAAKAGKLLGARYLVLGGYFDLMSTLRADARVVEVETGKVLQSIGTTGKPEDFLGVERTLSEGLARILVDKVGHAEEPVPEPKKSAPTKPRPAPPAALKTRTALAYSKALDAIDHKDKATAKAKLQEVIKEQPDFLLASIDLDKLVK